MLVLLFCDRNERLIKNGSAFIWRGRFLLKPMRWRAFFEKVLWRYLEEFYPGDMEYERSEFDAEGVCREASVI